jgi:leucyl aminopeptidase
MTVQLQATGRSAPRGLPIHITSKAGFAAQAAALDAPTRHWLQSTGFAGAPDSHALVPGADGRLGAVWAGVRDATDPWALAALPRSLPVGEYHLAAAVADAAVDAKGQAGPTLDPSAAALSWELGSYVFDVYKKSKRESATLCLPRSPATERGLLLAAAIASTRDLITTPAEHMGPAQLSQALRLVAKQHGARFQEVVGDQLLTANFPAIHAVGRAAQQPQRAPRLLEMNWGQAQHPRLTLVGKGVCFDSGGLDIKGADGMRWMKKDMGGAANVIGLAQMIMALGLPVQLQVLIPAVENAIAGNAFRPGDVFKTRLGLHIEIGNTDAEGRVILCDALAYAAEFKPDLIIDMATLTGAARVALGAQLPALFCRDMGMARELVDLGLAERDPLWHLPLWRDYHADIESDIADIVNTGRGGLAGAITAALFLNDFVPEGLPWLHLDLFAWNASNKPGRPVGGEAQTIRTLLAWLERRYTQR